jgi:uncharacterized protein YoxC
MDTLSAEIIFLALAFLVNFAGLIWGASSIASTVRHLDQTVKNLDKTVRFVVQRVGEMDSRVRLLEDRQER